MVAIHAAAVRLGVSRDRLVGALRALGLTPQPIPPGRTTPRRHPGKWVRQGLTDADLAQVAAYLDNPPPRVRRTPDPCRECRRTDRAIRAHGLCTACEERRRYALRRAARLAEATTPRRRTPSSLTTPETRMPRPPRLCKRPGCGLTFTPDTPERLTREREYCTDRCQYQAARQRRTGRGPLSPRTCACGCGQTFTPRRPDQQCVNKAHWRRANPGRSHKGSAPAPRPVPRTGPSRAAVARSRAAAECCPQCGALLACEGPLLWCRRREVGCDWAELVGQRPPAVDVGDLSEVA